MISELGRSAVEGIDYPLQYSWASLVAQWLRICVSIAGMWVRSLIGDVLHAVWYNQKKKKRKNLSSGFYGSGLPCGSAGKESARNAEDLGSIPGLGRSQPGEGKGYLLQYSGLENAMDCIVHGVAKSQT